MPGLSQRNEQLISENEFWSKHQDEISYKRLEKFWSELSVQARQKLMRIDKQTLFEQARKNMYCSRCNGLLLEGFLQIVMYGKSLQQEEGGMNLPYNRPCASKYQVDGHNEILDPSVHPWGGLTTTRDGSLTLLNCYLCSKSLKGLQIVFDSARARERERELLYPDACGGGGRGWISQGMGSYSRGHGTRETCALHTVRLSCDTLVDFWSALGEETRQSLLRMKEEDFIERLMYRFDSKRFCRDCRKNVIREYKELKELKRLRRETRCTSWFCVADTAFQCEVSNDTIKADWRQTFADMAGTYHHFEWAVGTSEGKYDILDFENVGLSWNVRVNGLDLSDPSACFVTLRAWKLDGRCTEICVKAHALRGQQCVHCRLIVGNGFVTITIGESIRRLFEHAEEAEEEEDDDSVDKDGNDLDGECSRPQKHAKSPELAREFLLDAATVIFKEQVEKAFREGTARQNAHSIFVCLALKLLEERVHVASKEIITLEKQMKLLEEEEKEKREEEERKERRRTKEREKKHRRKERLKGKERYKETKCLESNDVHVLPDISKDEICNVIEEEANDSVGRDSVSETADVALSVVQSPDVQDQTFSNGRGLAASQDESCDSIDGLLTDVKDRTNAFMFGQAKFSRQRLKGRKEAQLDSSFKWSDRRQFAAVLDSRPVINKSSSRCQTDNFDSTSGDINGANRQPRSSGSKFVTRNGFKFNEKCHCPNYRINDKHDLHSCSCRRNSEYRAKVEPHVNATRIDQERKLTNKTESSQDMSRQSYWGNKCTQADYVRESCGRTKNNCMTGNSSFRDLPNVKKVWEPIDLQKKHARSNSETEVALRFSRSEVEGLETDGKVYKSLGSTTPDSSGKVYCEENLNNARKLSAERYQDENVGVKGPCFVNEAACKEVNSCPVKSSISNGTSDPSLTSTSNSDNSSCFSEGDSNAFSSNHGSVETSSTSDSEDASQKMDGGKTSKSVQDGLLDCHGIGMENKQSTNGEVAFNDEKAFGHPDVPSTNFLQNPPSSIVRSPENGIPSISIDLQHQSMFPPMHNQGLQFPVIQDPSTMGYYHQDPVAWQAAAGNGFLAFPQPNQYFYAGDFGYGYNGISPMYMHYDPTQHWPTPLYNPGPFPVCPPAAGANVLHSEENTQTNKVQGTFAEITSKKIPPAGTSPLEAAPRSDAVKTDNSAKNKMGDGGFSLFQFDGPLSLSKGCKPLPSKDGIFEGFSSEVLPDQADNDSDCNEREIIEEYNLFATSNGIKFSFF